MKNPKENGVVLIETFDGHSECYFGPSKYSQPFKITERVDGGGVPFKDGFNPKKLVLKGKQINIYLKDVTISIDKSGNVKFLPVDTWTDENKL